MTLDRERLERGNSLWSWVPSGPSAPDTWTWHPLAGRAIKSHPGIHPLEPYKVYSSTCDHTHPYTRCQALPLHQPYTGRHVTSLDHAFAVFFP